MSTVGGSRSGRQVWVAIRGGQGEGFELCEGLYRDDAEFADVWQKCEVHPVQKFMRQEGFLFRNNRLCVPKCSLREAIVRESHAGGLSGHFEMDNTMLGLQDQSTWQQMHRVEVA